MLKKNLHYQGTKVYGYSHMKFHSIMLHTELNKNTKKKKFEITCYNHSLQWVEYTNIYRIIEREDL